MNQNISKMDLKTVNIKNYADEVKNAGSIIREAVCVDGKTFEDAIYLLSENISQLQKKIEDDVEYLTHKETEYYDKMSELESKEMN